MHKKLIYIIVNLSVFLHCFGLSLRHDQAIVLSCFFKTMLENSEGGYVLFDTKPVCINGFYHVDSFSGESDIHKERVFLYAGAAVWKDLQLKNSNHFIIHVYDHPDSLAQNSVHILFINKKLFLDTVQANLPLFQYVLGPELNPESLLNKLTDPNESFHSVLKNDKVLIGILLGFGTQNALYGGRVENVQDALFSVEQPPFINQFLNSGESLKGYKKILLISQVFHKAHDISPSFSYSSLSSEMKSLFHKMEVSSDKLSRERPFFIFGRLRNDKETDARVAELETSTL